MENKEQTNACYGCFGLQMETVMSVLGIGEIKK